ncbi:hypothetical protein NKH77_53465 [Streptomyces sp. M19]
MGFSSSLASQAERNTTLPPLTVEWYRTRLRVHTDDPRVHRHLASQHHAVAPDATVPEPLPAADLWVVADPDAIAGWRLGAPTGRRQAFTGEWYAEHRGADGETVLVAEDAARHPHALVTPDFRSWAVVAPGRRASASSPPAPYGSWCAGGRLRRRPDVPRRGGPTPQRARGVPRR